MTGGGETQGLVTQIKRQLRELAAMLEAEDEREWSSYCRTMARDFQGEISLAQELKDTFQEGCRFDDYLQERMASETTLQQEQTMMLAYWAQRIAQLAYYLCR